MALIIATGSNLGDSKGHLLHAKQRLSEKFRLEAQSRIYYSKAVDNEEQPDFFNQVLQFEIPLITPKDVLGILLEFERSMGRDRNIWRGPRTIDMDIIFWNMQSMTTKDLIVPHPRWMERSFVIRPLMELPFFQTVQKWFTIPESFKIEAFPI